MGQPKVSIVILNFNGKEYLKNCFNSLKNQTFLNYEVIMVDNASTDGSVEYVKRDFPWVKIIQNERNLGFAEGNNIGAKHASGDYIVFLNNDAEVHSRWLEELVRIANSDPSVGICGCKVLDLDQKNVIRNVGITLDKYGFPYDRAGGKKNNIQHDFITDAFVISGVAFLIRREIWKRTGGFDSALFIYVEELDLCWRTLLLGYRIVVNPFSVVYHRKMGMTTGKTPYAKKKYFSERNTLRTLLKNYGETTLFKVLPGYFAFILAEFFVALLVRKIQLALAYIQAVVWNTKNFKDTWRLHKSIQQMRVLDDDAIQNEMIRKSTKILLFKSIIARGA